MASSTFETPILLLVFNRPDKTRLVFEQIRAIRPQRLFIGADGSRNNKPGEERLCREVRDIVTRIDWECELKTLFSESNQGCKIASTRAYDWFFDDVEEGIILEDDLLPHPNFFKFCKELLEKYRNDARIMQISGANFQRGWCRDSSYSYYFSQIGSNWGWATWRRAWKLFDMNMSAYGEIKAKGYLNDACASKEELLLRLNNFDSVYTGKITTSWGHIWKYSMLINHGLSITPNANLITNIGFGVGATHTVGKQGVGLPHGDLEFPLKHPPFMIRDVISDTRRAKRILQMISPESHWSKLKRKLISWFSI